MGGSACGFLDGSSTGNVRLRTYTRQPLIAYAADKATRFGTAMCILPVQKRLQLHLAGVEKRRGSNFKSIRCACSGFSNHTAFNTFILILPVTN